MKGEILKRIDQIQHLEYTFSLNHFKIFLEGKKGFPSVCSLCNASEGETRCNDENMYIYSVNRKDGNLLNI